MVDFIKFKGISDDRQPTAKKRVILWCETGVKTNGKDSGWYNEVDISSNPNLLFLFGDNHKAKYRTEKSNPGGGGQARVIRGLYAYDRLQAHGGLNGNTIGITTTFYAQGAPNLNNYKKIVDTEFKPVEEWVKKGGCVIVPCKQNGMHNLGSGIADLDKKIPGAIEYVQQKINNLVKVGKQFNKEEPDLEELKQELHRQMEDDREFYHSNLVTQQTAHKAAKSSKGLTFIVSFVTLGIGLVVTSMDLFLNKSKVKSVITEGLIGIVISFAFSLTVGCATHFLQQQPKTALQNTKENTTNNLCCNF